MVISARDFTVDRLGASAQVLERATHLAAPIACLQCVAFAKGGDHVVVTAGGSAIRAMRLREVVEIAESRGGQGVEQRGCEWTQGGVSEHGVEAFPMIAAGANAPATGMEAIEEYLAALQLCKENGHECRGNDASADQSGLRCSKLILQTGQVASLAVCALPEGISAFGVAGTTHGTLCVFLMEGSVLSLLNERSLGPCSEGRISADDIVKDVAISMDPAGRPEFVVAATDRCMVLLDVLDLVDESESPNVSDTIIPEGCDTENRATHAITRAQAPFTAGAVWRWPSTVQRDRSEPLCVTFSNTASASHIGAPSSLCGDEVSEIVRVLVPQRAHAAFAIDVAAVIVLADSTVRYIERRVCGGSFPLLLEYHQALQHAASRSTVMVNELLGETSRFSGSHSPNAAPQTTLPHVKFDYRLSLQSFNAYQCADGSTAVGNWTKPGCRHDLSLTVNDASLFFNPKSGRMDLMMVGCRHATHQPYSIPGREMGGSSLAKSPLGAAAEPARGAWRVGWWAVAGSVVLTQQTLYPYVSPSVSLRGRAQDPDHARPTIHVQSAILNTDGYEDFTSVYGAPTAIRRGRLERSPAVGVDAIAKVHVFHRLGEPAAVLVGGGGLLFLPGLPAAGDLVDGVRAASAPRTLHLSNAVIEDVAVAEAGGHPACVLCAAGSTLTFLPI
ncbi:unnamed protein product [Phytomonas sp. Hart1]|nr:unnamed protein product [Phytomonas sp. Hart1]|eukprot:CCW66694.1 unnamed protein product [Phytomonas sp. isolate Hart1]